MKKFLSFFERLVDIKIFHLISRLLQKFPKKKFKVFNICSHR